jgi:ribosomal protein S18 acetylase RimI-like enzyme
MINKPYHHPEDFQRLVEFIQSTRSPSWRLDYPSRMDLEELLVLPEIQHQTSLWENGQGNLMAFALIDPYHNLLFDILPESNFQEIAEKILEWAIDILKNNTDAICLDASCREEDTRRCTFFTENGFTLQEERSIHMQRSLKLPILKPKFPNGFTVRPLAGEQELTDYVHLHQTVFATTNMTKEMRRAIMRSSEYVPELDLVLVNPTGQLVGFLHCQIDKNEIEQTGIQAAWTDPIGIHPEYRKKDLARNLLLYGLNLLAQRGIEQAKLTTLNTNTGAIKTFQSVGFKILGSKIWWRRLLRHMKY